MSASEIVQIYRQILKLIPFCYPTQAHARPFVLDQVRSKFRQSNLDQIESLKNAQVALQMIRKSCPPVIDFHQSPGQKLLIERISRKYSQSAVSSPSQSQSVVSSPSQSQSVVSSPSQSQSVVSSPQPQSQSVVSSPQPQSAVSSPQSHSAVSSAIAAASIKRTHLIDHIPSSGNDSSSLNLNVLISPKSTDLDFYYEPDSTIKISPAFDQPLPSSVAEDSSIRIVPGMRPLSVQSSSSTNAVYSTVLLEIFQKNAISTNSSSSAARVEISHRSEMRDNSADGDLLLKSPLLTPCSVSSESSVDPKKAAEPAGLSGLFNNDHPIPSNLPIRGPTIPLSESRQWNTSFLESLKSEN